MKKDVIFDTEDILDPSQTAHDYIALCSSRYLSLVREDTDKAHELDEKISYFNQLLFKTGTFEEVYKHVKGFIDHTYATGNADQHTLAYCGKAVVAVQQLEKGLVDNKARDLIGLSRQQSEAKFMNDKESETELGVAIYDTCISYQEDGSLGAVCECLQGKIYELYDTPTDFPHPDEMEEIQRHEAVIQNVLNYANAVPVPGQLTIEDCQE